MLGLNISSILKIVTNTTGPVLAEYVLYGEWIILSHQNIKDPKIYYWSLAFKQVMKTLMSIESFKQQHAIDFAYRRYRRRARCNINYSPNICVEVYEGLRHSVFSNISIENMNKTMLPIRLNRYISSAVIIKSFGNSEVYDRLREFDNALQDLTIQIKRNVKNHELTRDSFGNLVKAMGSWSELMKRVDKLNVIKAKLANLTSVCTVATMAQYGVT